MLGLKKVVEITNVTEVVSGNRSIAIYLQAKQSLIQHDKNDHVNDCANNCANN